MVETYEALRSQSESRIDWCRIVRLILDGRPPVQRRTTPHAFWSRTSLSLPYSFFSTDIPMQSDEVLRREEEDLQRALAESAALSDPLRGFQKSQASHSNSNDFSSRKTLPNEPEYSNRRPASPESYGFAPPTNSSVVQGGGRRNDSRGGGGRSSSQRYSQDEPREEEQGGALRTNGTSQPQRVKALYDFNTETPEELPFRKGDVIRVLECVYEAWWRGELKGRVGIFPTVYVVRLFPFSLRMTMILMRGGSRKRLWNQHRRVSHKRQRTRRRCLRSRRRLTSCSI